MEFKVEVRDEAGQLRQHFWYDGELEALAKADELADRFGVTVEQTTILTLRPHERKSQ